MQFLFFFIIIVPSAIIHEYAHGFAADWLGDPTARNAGRLTLDPRAHIDIFGTILMPILLLVVSAGNFMFAYAEPVPYNPYNFTNQKWGEAIVAAAGPASNVALAIIFALLIRFSGVLSLSQTFIELSFGIVILNLFLAFFNLVPIPPLDGSKILPRLLPFSLAMKYEAFRRYFEYNAMVGFLLVIFVFVYFLGDPLYRLTFAIARFLVGG